MWVDKNIFREYDLRGLAQTELTADFAFGLGQSFVVYLEKKGGTTENDSALPTNIGGVTSTIGRTTG